MAYFIIVTLISLILYPGIGLNLINLISAVLNSKRTKENYLDNNLIYIFCTCLALQVHLWCTYGFYLLGIQIHVAFVASLFLLGFSTRKTQIVAVAASSSKVKNLIVYGLSVQSLIFTFLLLFFAISGVWEDGDLLTLWANNYGDFPFHAALINNFSFNSHVITDYPVFPGSRLSYYFMYDFWAACLQLSPNSWRVFSLIMVFQWMFCWTIVYLSLAYFSSSILLYPILFGGGAYAIFYKQFMSIINGGTTSELLSHRYIDNSYPWTVLISTVWVPQRVAVFGLALGIPAICLIGTTVISMLKRCKGSQEQCRLVKLPSLNVLVITGIYLALMTISHFYFAMIGLLILGLISTILIITKPFLRFTLSRALLLTILSAGLCVMPAALIFSGKGGMLSLMPGWMPWKIDVLDYLNGFLGSATMWSANGLALIVIFLAFYYHLHKVFITTFLILFIIFNIVKLSSWDWDAYKIFIALYCYAVALLAITKRSKIFDTVILFVLCLPALMETIIIIADTNPVAIYTKTDLYRTRLLRQRTNDGVIISEPIHNSIVTLAGKNIYAGYPGWLASHDLPYKNRLQKNADILQTPACDIYPKFDERPEYVYFSKDPGGIPASIQDPILRGLISIEKQCKQFEM